MNKTLRLLLAEDSDDDALLIADAVRRHGIDFAATRVMSAKDFQASLETSDWDLVLCDYSMPGFDGMKALELLGETGRDIPFIIVSGTIGEDVAVKMLKLGANDYILKQNLARLGPAIEHELRDAEVRRQRRLIEAFSKGQGEVLEWILENRPLPEILTHIAHRIESLPLSASEPLCSILLTDSGGTRLTLGAAPSLPPAFCRSIQENPVSIAPGNGAAGTAAARRQTVITEDVALDPDWEQVRECALRFGLRACWAVPVFASNRELLGTVDVYYRTVRRPADEEIKWVEEATKLVALAVERSRTAAALQEHQDRIRSTFAAAGAGIAMINVDGTLIMANRTYCYMLGYSEDELRQTDVFSLTHPEDRPFNRRLVERLLAGEIDDFKLEKRCLRKDGRIVWVRANVALVPFGNGRSVNIVMVTEDITEQKAVEEKLRQSESLLEIAGKIAHLGGWEADLAEHRLYWSDEVCAIHEVPAGSEFTLEEAIAFYVPEHRDRIRDAVHACIREGVPFDEELQLITARGKRIWARAIGRAVRDADGVIERICGAFQDITERKQSETRLAEQAALLDKAHDAILVRDLNGMIRFWNKGAERLYGWSAAEATGADIRDLIYKDPGIFEKANQWVLDQDEWTGEIQQADRNGKQIIARASWSLVRNTADEPDSVLAINTDITESKQMEQQFLRAQRMEGIGALAGGIAHDLNNVLSPIMMATELLRQGNLDENSAGLLNAIETSAKRGAEMTRQVLSFARGASGERIPTPPKHVINEVVRIVGETFPKNIRIQAVIADDVRPILGDPTQLNQVLLNLCINARDAMGAGGTLTISAMNVVLDERFIRINREGAPGPHVLVQVNDTGEGISEDNLPRVFDPFFTTKEAGRGTGLGLSTAMSIIRAHKGFVRLDSEIGAGTTLKLYFPAADSEKYASVEPTESTLPRGAGECILVIDDEAAVRAVARQTLEVFGYQVMLASDGHQGVETYKNNRDKIDVVLTDMMMPVMDGEAAIKAIRNENSRVPIIAMSGLNSRERDVSHALGGAEVFLNKPFTSERLLKVLHEVLGK